MKYGPVSIIVLFSLSIYAQVPVLGPKDITLLYQTLSISEVSSLDSSLTTLLTAAARYAQADDKALRAGVDLAIGICYFNKKVYDQSLRYLTGALAGYTAIDRATAQPWIESFIGKAQFHRGNYLLAAQTFSSALRSLEKYKDERTEDEIRDYMSKIYNLMPRVNLTDKFFIQSFTIKEKLGDRLGMLRVAQRLVEIYHQNNQYQQSLNYADKAIGLANELHRKDDVLQAQLDRIVNLIRLEKKPESLAAIHQLDIGDITPSDIHFRSKYETALGDYYLMWGDEKTALSHYALALPPRISPTIAQYVYKHQAESYKHIGLFQKAVEAQERYIREFSASHLNNVLAEVAQIEEQSAKIKLNDEIVYLNAQNRLKDSLISREKLLAEALAVKNQYQLQQLQDQEKLSAAIHREIGLQKQKINDEIRLRMLFIGSSIALLLLGTAVYYLYRKQKSKNQIISKQSSENEMLMKEIHHRVKNNLQIISSLLDMQSMSLKDSKASEAIKEGKNRVQSMALIHQNLYKDGHIRSIKIDDYIHHLATSLFDSYHIEKNKITLQEEVTPIYLDVDTVVPLGLIVNELISNALKYGFKNQDSGTISISLKEQHDNLFFQLRDNGVGFPADWSPDGNRSFGYQLVKAFAKKIKAKLHTYNDRGAVVELTIAKYKLAP